MMKILKMLVAVVLLCMIVTTMAQDLETDSYSYQANPTCEVKISIKGDALLTEPITYSLTYQGAVPTVGTVAAGASAQLRLPVSRQWYSLTIERDAADEGLYTISTGCGGFNAQAVNAPAPILNEDQWAAARAKLSQFLKSLNAR
jgi:hypothetical protein